MRGAPGAAGLSGLLLALPLSGCLGAPAPQLVLEGVFSQSDASYDAGAGLYTVNLRGRLLNQGAGEAHGVVVLAGVGTDCLTEPEMPGYIPLGNLAPGSSANVRGSFQQASPRLEEPLLWYRVLQGGRRADEGCGPLPVG